MFYTYHQNMRMGGGLKINLNLAHFVIIEASTAADADRRAEKVGIYFDGAMRGLDYPDHGDRWYKHFGKGTEVARVGSYLAEDYVERENLFNDEVRIHYLDGYICLLAARRSSVVDSR